MSRFDRCDERFMMALGAGVPVPGACIRASVVIGLLSLVACTSPSARLDGEQARTDPPAQATNEGIEASEGRLRSEESQVQGVPSTAELAGLAANVVPRPGTVPLNASAIRPGEIDDAASVSSNPDGLAATAASDSGDASDAELIGVAIVPAEVDATPDLQKIQATLRRLAAEADDPVPYHLAASILPVIGLKGSAEAEADPFLVPEADLDGEEAAMLGEVAAFATGLRARIDAGEPTKTVLLEELDALLERLERGSRLTIAVAELCREVRGAGDYELLPRVFASGQPQEVLIYVDLEGEEWTEIDGGEWEWAVDWKLELHQVSDRSIADQTGWNRQQTRRAYAVDDNYLLIRYTIPAEDLASALYVLKVRFREPGTNRETETGIQFQLVPRRTIAAQGG